MEHSGSVLDNVVIKDLVREKELLCTALPQEEISHCLKKMALNNVISLPIYDKDGKGFQGIVNMMDILTYVAYFVFNKETPILNNLLEMGEQMEKLDHPIENCLGITEESKTLWSYPEDTPITKVLEAFSKGVHRVLVEGEKGGVWMLTQSDVISFLSKIESKVPWIEKTIEELNMLKHKKVICCQHTDSAIEGFRKLSRSESSACPIVDSSNKIVGTLSASSLRGVTPLELDTLNLNVIEFLKRQKQHHFGLPILCKKNNTMEEILIKLADSRVHRLWLVDDDMHPTDVISLSDVIKKFSPYDAFGKTL